MKGMSVLLTSNQQHTSWSTSPLRRDSPIPAWRLPKPSSQLDVMIVPLVSKSAWSLTCFLYDGLTCMVQDPACKPFTSKYWPSGIIPVLFVFAACCSALQGEQSTHTKTHDLGRNQSGNIQTKEAILKGQYPTGERWNLLRWGFPPLTGPSSIPSSHGTLVRLIDKATHCVLGPWKFRIPWDDKIVKHFWQSWESVRHDTSPKRK